jgi:hypothetical protein
MASRRQGRGEAWRSCRKRASSQAVRAACESKFGDAMQRVRRAHVDGAGPCVCMLSCADMHESVSHCQICMRAPQTCALPNLRASCGGSCTERAQQRARTEQHHRMLSLFSHTGDFTPVHANPSFCSTASRPDALCCAVLHASIHRSDAAFHRDPPHATRTTRALSGPARRVPARSAPL